MTDGPGISEEQQRRLDRIYAGSRTSVTISRDMVLHAIVPVVTAVLIAFASWSLVAMLPNESKVVWNIATVALYVCVIVVAASARHLTRLGVAACGAGLGAVVAMAALTQTTVGTYWASPFKLAAAAFAASLLTIMFDRLTWVLVAAAVMTASDLWSVYSSAGLTNHLASADKGTASGTLLDALAIAAPAPAAADGGFLGIVDVLFSSLFVQVSMLWGLDMRRTIVALALGFGITDTVGRVTGDLVPALPAMALMFVAAHARLLIAAIRDDMARSGGG